MTTLKVLVVCYGNRCRSPMFEALLRNEFERWGVQAEVESAGVSTADETGRPAGDNAQTCMRERGLDLSSHRSRHVSSFALSDFTFIYVMEEKFVAELVAHGASESSVVVLNKDGGGVANPFEKGLDAYRACAAQLEDIARGIAILRAEGPNA